MRIIPAIDIIEGKCVRLSKGDFSSKKIYNEDPLEAAKRFEDNGMKYLHLVDLDGARTGMVINFRIIELLASRTSLKIDFGGGIRTESDLKIAFASGASQVTAGSVAVSDPTMFQDWLGRYGSERIILGADCVNRKIVTGGWKEESGKDVIDFITAFFSQGVKYTICTDVDRDGMMHGPATALYRDILGSAAINLIASGGISSKRDIEDLKEAGCEGAIIGKAIYEGKIKVKELRDLC